MTAPIKVLIVDDSALMRVMIRNILSSESAIQTEKAKDGKEALKKIAAWSPDVVTLDIAMPIMNGLETLRAIMKSHPTRVIMLSGLGEPKIVFDALKEGAIDFIVKPSVKGQNVETLKEELLAKINMAAHVDLKKVINSNLRGAKQIKRASFAAHIKKAVAIGASTGGPSALELVVRSLPDNLAYPVFIVQHLPVGFSKSLAGRLNAASKLKAKEGEHGEVVEDGVIYLAPAGYHMTVDKPKSDIVEIIRLDHEPRINGLRPSVDRMMDSVANIYGAETLGVLLTGMGFDGVEGLSTIKKFGGKTIVQDEKSSVVYGMPGAAVKSGCADKIVPVKNIAEEIVKVLSGKEEWVSWETCLNI